MPMVSPYDDTLDRDLERNVPYMFTPRHMPTFVRCPWCHRLSLDLTAGECEDCAFNGICAICGDGIPVDMQSNIYSQAHHFCEAEMDEWEKAES